MANKLEPEVRRMILVRKCLGLTQRQLAERTGYSLSYVRKIESGNRPLTIRYLRAYCLALGASSDYILQ